MKQLYRMVMMTLLVGGLVGLSACSEDEEPGPKDSSLTDVGPDGGSDAEPDTTPDDAGDGGNEDEPDACTPSITECSADMCGQVDNGCGETLDCGECPCSAGVVQDPSCGTCGLGERTCESDETGFGSCSSPDIPGVAEDADAATCESKLVYVNAGSSAGGDGTKDAPFATYADAVATATSGQVILIGGQTTLQEEILVKKGVSVIGGFDGDFQWGEGRQARIEVQAPTDAAVMGIKAEGVDQDTVLANLSVTTADATAGNTNYGAYLVDSSNLTMRNVIVQAGKGGAGAPGDDGSNGADGGNGSDGTPGQSSSQAGVPGASGGVNVACASANGGAGGRGATNGQAGDYPSRDGESTAQADGGSAGYDQLGQRAGDDGQDATAPTQAGTNGQGGESGGQVTNDMWDPKGAGVDGQRGPHGYGGGGGGGAWFASNPYIHGSGGAGGGAGGCGGEGGQGGQPGAGSFGLFLVRSDVTLVNSEFQSGLGGVGGNGGQAGRGGQGGRGGVGTAQSYPSALPWTSGDGGDGSRGADGGAGGGGAGGVSYGVYCSQSRPTVDQDTEFVSGGSAAGGQSPGNAGNDGLSEDSVGCD